MYIVYYTTVFKILRRWTDKITHTCIAHRGKMQELYDNVIYYECVFA